MGRQESADLLSQFVVFRGTEEPAVGHGLEHVELRLDAAGPKLPVHPDGVGQEQVSGSRLQEGRWEGGGEVAEQRRQIGVSQIVVTGIQGDGVGQTLRQHVVDAKICVERVAGLGQVDFGRQQDKGGREGQPLVSRPQHQRGSQVATR